MKVSDYIDHLIELKQKCGDLEVYESDPSSTVLGACRLANLPAAFYLVDTTKTRAKTMRRWISSVETETNKGEMIAYVGR